MDVFVGSSNSKCMKLVHMQLLKYMTDKIVTLEISCALYMVGPDMEAKRVVQFREQ